jgi:hypothetical protein
MRHLGLVGLAALLAACGSEPDLEPLEAPAAAPNRALQEQVCAARVAEHTGLTIEEMRPEWTGPTDTGTDIVFVHHGVTLHTCEVDADGQVLELQHPQNE